MPGSCFQFQAGVVASWCAGLHTSTQVRTRAQMHSMQACLPAGKRAGFQGLQACTQAVLQTCRHSGMRAYRHAGKQAYKPALTQTCRHTSVQADRHARMQACRRAGVQACRHAGMNMFPACHHLGAFRGCPAATFLSKMPLAEEGKDVTEEGIPFRTRYARAGRQPLHYQALLHPLSRL